MAKISRAKEVFHFIFLSLRIQKKLNCGVIATCKRLHVYKGVWDVYWTGTATVLKNGGTNQASTEGLILEDKEEASLCNAHGRTPGSKI